MYTVPCYVGAYRLIKSMDFDVVVFDTAPTGHTLRFLQMPATIEKGFGVFDRLSGMFGGLLNTVRHLIRMQ